MNYCSMVLSLVLFSLLTGGIAQAGGPPNYTIERIAIEGDPAPTTGTLEAIYDTPAIDDDGRIAAKANTDTGPSYELHVLWDGTSLGAELVEKTSLPSIPGSVIEAPGSGVIAAPDIFAFSVTYSPAPVGIGAFLRVGTSESALLLPGDPAPGGGTVAGLGSVSDVNENGVSSFGGFVDPGDGSSLQAIFTGSPGSIFEVCREGDATPAGGVWSDFGGYNLNSAIQLDDSVAFWGEITGGSAAEGIFLWQAGVITPLALEGSALPDGSGDQFYAFQRSVGSNEAGDVSILAFIQRSGGGVEHAVYTLSGGQIEIEIDFLDPVPGTNPQRYYKRGGSLSTPPDISASGVVAHVADLAQSKFDPNYLYSILASKDGETKIVAKEGDPVPGMPGVAFERFENARINSSGQITFIATTDQGQEAIFLATPIPTAVPALRPTGLVIALMGIVLTGATLLRRRNTQ
jgi:hypothetical protein